MIRTTLDSKRLPNEDFKTYKESLAETNKALKRRLRSGKLVWCASNLIHKKTNDKGQLLPGAETEPKGAYIRKIHGELQ